MFLQEYNHYLRIEGVTTPTRAEPEHLIALFFQIRRAFFHIFQYIVGGSKPAARLRTAVWQSIFTHDLRRGEQSADELLDRYCTLVYRQTGSYGAAGRRLGLDRRTVRGRVDQRWLKRLGET